MPPGQEIIDLTLSDSENEQAPPPKRPRAAPVDDEVVIVESGHASPAKNNELDTDEILGDNEVKLVSVTGEDWTKLPHTRDLCRKYPFSSAFRTSNVRHCERCFCYVCDCPVAQCKDWGNGSSQIHHCNASSKNVTFQTMRTDRQSRAALAPPRPAAAATGGGSGSGSGSGSGGVISASAAAIRATLNDKMGWFGLGGSHPNSPPGPSTGTTSSGMEESMGGEDGNGSEEGLRGVLPSYASYLPPFITPHIKKKKKKNKHKKAGQPGQPPKCTYKEVPDPSNDAELMKLAVLEFDCEVKNARQSIPDIASRLAPHGFYRSSLARHNMSYGNRLTLGHLINEQYGAFNPPTVEIIPRVQIQPPIEPTADRVRAVLLHFWDGRALPTLYGVTVPPSATVNQILEALRLQLELPTSLKIAAEFRSTTRDGAAVIDDAWVGRKAAYDGGVAYLTAYCFPTPNPDVLPEWGQQKNEVMIAVMQRENENNPVRSASLKKVTEVVLPIDPSHLTGGRRARDSLVTALLLALQPYRRNPQDAEETASLAKSLKLHWGNDRSSGYISYFTIANEERSGATLFSNKRDLSRVHKEYRVEVNTLFKPLGLSAVWPEGFDMDGAFNAAAWEEHPADAPTAASELLQPSLDYAAAVRKHERDVNAAKSLPTSIIQEILRHSRLLDPEVQLTATEAAAVQRSDDLPMCCHKTELVPASPDENEKRGKLRIHVFVWRVASARNKAFFQPSEDWGAAATGRRGFSRGQRSVHNHPLMLTLAYTYADNPAFAAFEAHRKKWVEKDADLSHRRSIAALMDAMEKPEAPAVEQPPGLTVTLHPYQKQSLKFMLDAEAAEGGFRKHFWVPLTAADGTQFWYSSLFGRTSRTVATQCSGGFCCEEMGLGKTVEVLALCLANPARQFTRGEKTAAGHLRSRATLVVCAVSLVGQWIEEAKQKTAGSLRIHMYHGPNRIRDAKRLANDFDLVVTTYATLSYDCGTKRSAAGFSTANTPLHNIQWHRLVLDESHTCKNPVVGHTKACVALDAPRRWMCTGTPINTDVLDLFGQFAVLKMSPFNNKNFFDSNVRNAFGNNVYSGGCLELLHAMGHVMVRHTKRQEVGGQQVLQLPPKTEQLVPVILTAREQAAYRHVHATVLEYFHRYERLGAHGVSRNLLHIMSLLLPMRRICSGGALSPAELTVSAPDISDEAIEAADAAFARGGGGGGGGPASAAAAAESITIDENLVAPAGECSICLDAYEQPAITTCGHWFCKMCIIGALQMSNARCPLCRATQRAQQLKCGITAAEAEERAAEKNATSANGEEDRLAAAASAEAAALARVEEREAAIAASSQGVISESKLVALLKELRAMRRSDPTAKALIFSQYNSTIEWLKARLTREGFGHRHISGSMPLKARAKAIQAFQSDPPTSVFLLSMRSGAVGINLTAASHVFLLEPALNPALEEQAIGRAWRMGQQREVKVLRFYVKGSVEERIMEVVKTRQTGVAGAAAAANATTTAAATFGGGGGDGGASGSGANGRFTLPSLEELLYEAHEQQHRGGGGRRAGGVRVEDQAGSIKEDKQNLRLSELQVLFRAPEFPEPRVDAPLSDDDDMDVDGGDGDGAYLSRDVRNITTTATANRLPRGLPAALGRSNMRRSKAGIAAAMVAANTPARPDSASGDRGDTIYNDGGATGSGGGGNGATPAATVAALTTTPHYDDQQQHQKQQKEQQEVEMEEDEEMEEEEVDADMLQHIRNLTQKSNASGRLTPNDGNGSRPPSAAGGGGANAGTGAGILNSSDGAGSVAVAAHLSRPTPATGRGIGGGDGDGDDGRPSRRRTARRRNYAALNLGESEEEGEENDVKDGDDDDYVVAADDDDDDGVDDDDGDDNE